MGKPSHHRCCRAAAALLQLLLLPSAHHLVSASRPNTAGCRVSALASPGSDVCGGGGGDGVCRDEVTASVNEAGFWYARLGAEAAAAVSNGDAFDLRADALCLEKPLRAQVTVSPRINATSPVGGSYAHVEIEIAPGVAGGHDKLYLCFKGRAALPPCLAALAAPRMSLMLRSLSAFAALAEVVVGRPELVRALDEVSMLGYAALEVALILVSVLFLLSLLRALWALARLPPGAGQTASLRAVQAHDPAVTLVSAAVRVLAFVAAVANLIGIGLPLMMKTVHPYLLAAIYMWPCTFGVYAVARAALLVCSVQRYQAGLLLGKVVLAGRAKAAHEALAAAGVMLLFVCYFSAMAYSWSASGVSDSFVIVMSPILSIVGALVTLRGHEQEQSKQLVRVSLRDLAALDLAGLDAGAGADGLTLVSGKTMVEVSEASFCNTWRSSADPISMLADSPEGSPAEGKEFGFRDWGWHAEYIYRVTGSRAAFFNLPVMLVFAAMLILTSMQWFLQCVTMLPTLKRVDFGRGLLTPPFQPERRFYTLYSDASVLDVQLLHTMEKATTDQVSIRVSHGAYHNSTVSGGLAAINLRSVKAPWDVQILAQGTWGRAKEYSLQLLPVSTIVRTVSLKAKDWVRCIEWATTEKHHVVMVPFGASSLDVELTMEEFVFSRPGGDEPQTYSNGGIYTQFEVLNGSGASCSEWCDDHPRCRAAWNGIGGCFLGMVPKGLSSCWSRSALSSDAVGFSASPYHEFLRSRINRTFVQLCMLEKAGVESCHTARRDEIGRVHIGGIRISEESATARLYVRRVGGEGRHFKIASQSLRLLQRAPGVQEALVVAEGVHTAVLVQSAKSKISIMIEDMNFSAVPDPFPITIVPLVEDVAFYDVMTMTPSYYTRGEWKCEERRSLRLVEACAANRAFRHLTVCGGPTYSQACTISVPKWNPSGEWELRLAPRGMDPRALRVGLEVTMAHDSTPAEMALRKDCAVNFDKPAEVARGWISSGMFQIGMEFCARRNVTLKASASSFFSPVRFSLMGMFMYPSKAAEFVNSAVRDGILLEEQLDKDAELAPTPHGLSIKVPPHTISRDLAVWAPWVPAVPAELDFNLAALIRDGLVMAARFACLRSALTPRSALTALLAVVTREIHESKAKTWTLIAVLARCIESKNVILGVPAEHQSPVLLAIRNNRVDIYNALGSAIRTLAVGMTLKRGRAIFYAERAVESLALAYGCAGCIYMVRTMNLTGLSLTEREVPGMVAVMGHVRGMQTLDLSWNRLGLRGVGQLLDAHRVEEKPKLRCLRIGHNMEEAIAVAESAPRGRVKAAVRSGAEEVSWSRLLAGMPELQELDLSGSNIGPSSAQELGLVLEGMPLLEILNLSANSLGDKGVAALAASLESLRALRSLDLSGNNVGAAGLRALKGAALSSLEFLYMSENSLGEDNCSALADVLAHMARLQHLSIGGNHISVAGAVRIEAVVSSLALLRMLDVSQNPITDVGLAALHLARLSNLTALDLSGTGLGVRGSSTLAAALLALPRLRTLGLDSNGFGAAGIAAIAPALRGAKQLTSLALGANAIGANARGAAELAHALWGLPHLRHLDIRQNHLCTADLRVICEPLRGMSHLETLRIQGNDFSSDALLLWRCLAGLTPLRVLDLSSSRVFAVRTGAWKAEMKLALQGMRNLEHLVLYGNQCPPQDLPYIMGYIMYLRDKDAISLKLLQVHGVVPVPGDITEEDLQMVQGMCPWILLV